MKTSSTALTLAAAAMALVACSQSDRTTGNVTPSTALKDPTGYSAPPASPQYGPPSADANRMAPGTDAATAFGNEPKLKDVPDQQIAGASTEDQHRAVEAQEAAAKSPDTATADNAKNEVLAGNEAQRSGGTARDTPANQPRSGTVTKEEESTQMPKAGQTNNHSSTALEKDSGR